MKVLQTFSIGERLFQHHIYLEDDDRVELVDVESGETLLIYTANCEIVSPEGKIGDFVTEGGYWVSYTDPLRTRRVHRPDSVAYDSLLLSEVDYSRKFIAGFGPAL